MLIVLTLLKRVDMRPKIFYFSLTALSQLKRNLTLHLFDVLDSTLQVKVFAN